MKRLNCNLELLTLTACIILFFLFFRFNSYSTYEIKESLKVTNITTETRQVIVLGIQSGDGDDKEIRRQSVRSTWINNILTNTQKLPFRVIYKFLMDQPTNQSRKENIKYNDIIYLNLTDHGWAVKFGQKTYVWFKYIHEYYPGAILGVKLDDDVFLCVPQVFHRLNSVLSPQLYYGWKGKVPRRGIFIDEMFVALGRNLISRIASRKYCGKEICKNKEDLVEYRFGSTSLAKWISIYNDVNFTADNDKIIHFLKYKRNIERHVKFIQPNFCEKYVIFHKAYTKEMKQLQEFNEIILQTSKR